MQVNELLLHGRDERMTKAEIFASAQRVISLYRSKGYQIPKALEWADGTPCPVCDERVTEDERGGPCTSCFGLLEAK